MTLLFALLVLWLLWVLPRRLSESAARNRDEANRLKGLLSDYKAGSPEARKELAGSCELNFVDRMFLNR